MDLSNRLNHVFGPLIALLVMIYFGYHIVQGERGLISWMRLRQKITVSEGQLSVVQEEKETLQRRVNLLRPDSLDRDMLEERAYEVLNLGNPGDTIILNQDFDQKDRDPS
jgi:cell division protein FtsB